MGSFGGVGRRDGTFFKLNVKLLLISVVILVSVFVTVVNSAPSPPSTSLTARFPRKIKFDSTSKKNQKNVEEMANMFEGDIILSLDQEKAINSAMVARLGLAGGLAGIVGDKYRWEDRLVHYEISDEYFEDERELIEAAMEEIGEKTCIRFDERDGEEDYIKIEDGNGCSSKVGKRGGEQTVTLSKNGCLKHGVAIHELVHAIGFWHEQSRTDRDKYVDIIWKNIEPGKNINFSKYLKGEINENKVPYDYNSVMHYRADAFQHEDTDEDTIVPKDPDAEIGQRRRLSELDALKINYMYCPELIKNGTYTPAAVPPSTNKEDEEDGDDDQDEEDESQSDESEEDKRKRTDHNSNENQRVSYDILT